MGASARGDEDEGVPMVRMIEYRRFGGPEVMEMVEAPEPVPGVGQVRVAVKAVGLNPVDWKIVSGMMGGDGPQRPQGVGGSDPLSQGYDHRVHTQDDLHDDGAAG